MNPKLIKITSWEDYVAWKHRAMHPFLSYVTNVRYWLKEVWQYSKINESVTSSHTDCKRRQWKMKRQCDNGNHKNPLPIQMQSGIWCCCVNRENGRTESWERKPRKLFNLDAFYIYRHNEILSRASITAVIVSRGE